MPSNYWRKRWKAEHWIRLLYGRICDPSMARLGVARWISCLRDTRANLSASQDPERGRTILATCGPTFAGSSGSVDRPSSSSRTSPGICRLEDTKSSGTFKAWAIALRRVSSQRRKSARPTDVSGSSSWPTVNAGNFNDGENVETWKKCRAKLRAQGVNGNGMGTPLSIAVRLWPTTTTTDAKASGAAGYSTESGRHAGTTLTDAVRGLWPTTATTRDGKDGACADANVPTNALLGRQVLRMSWDGESTSHAGQVLNPRFCEALMGWPIGWTACACAETESSPIKPPSHSENSPAIYWAHLFEAKP